MKCISVLVITLFIHFYLLDANKMPFDPDNPPWTKVPVPAKRDNPLILDTYFKQKYFLL